MPNLLCLLLFTVSVDSDSPPPLPDRNYYDMDQAGEYTQLRRDALPPKQPREKDFHLTSPEYVSYHDPSR